MSSGNATSKSTTSKKTGSKSSKSGGSSKTSTAGSTKADTTSTKSNGNRSKSGAGRSTGSGSRSTGSGNRSTGAAGRRVATTGRGKGDARPIDDAAMRDQSSTQTDSTLNDITGVIISVLAIAMFIALVMPGTAVFTSWISNCLSLAFGIGAFCVPIALLVWGVSFFMDMRGSSTVRVGLGIAIILIAVFTCLSLYTPGAEKNVDLLFADAALRARGGYLGAGIAWCLLKLFGRVIGTIIMIGCGVAGIVVIGFSISASVAETQGRIAVAREHRAAANQMQPTMARGRFASTDVVFDDSYDEGEDDGGYYDDGVTIVTPPRTGGRRASGYGTGSFAADDGATTELYGEDDYDGATTQINGGGYSGATTRLRGNGSAATTQLRGNGSAATTQLRGNGGSDATIQMRANGFDGATTRMRANGLEGAATRVFADDTVFGSRDGEGDGFDGAFDDSQFPVFDEGGSAPTVMFGSDVGSGRRTYTRKIPPYTPRKPHARLIDSLTSDTDAADTYLYGSGASPASLFGDPFGYDGSENVAGAAIGGLSGRSSDGYGDPWASGNGDASMDEYDDASMSGYGDASTDGLSAVGGFAATTAMLEDEFGDGAGTSVITPANRGGAGTAKTGGAAGSASDAASTGAKRARSSSKQAGSKDADGAGKQITPSANPSSTSDEDGFATPPAKLIKTTPASSLRANKIGESEVQETANKLQETLESFNLFASVVGWVAGPTFTMFKVEMPTGVRLARITSLQDDIALALAAESVRIFAPIPGTSLVGIEIPNKKQQMVLLGDVLAAAKADAGPLTVAIGKNVEGEMILADLAKMPHLLIGGTTGSGKSVCINSMLMSILMRATPDQVRMILIDPKRVELTLYNGIPHLYVPVVTDPKEAASALAWATIEMDRRLKVFEKAGTRNIGFYNSMVRDGRLGEDAEEMPYIVVVIDELSDLMMVAGKDVEGSIVRIAQLARAAGIHLIVATQRPSANVVTGLIKANIINRIAFKVATGIDSRVILDQAGAEKLVGHGDMLFLRGDGSEPSRIQGCYVDEGETNAVVDYLKEQGEPDYHGDILKIRSGGVSSGGSDSSSSSGDDDDPLLWDAAEIVVSSGLGSTSNIQRRLKVGYARAGRIMDQLEEKGVVGPPDGSRPREVLVSDVVELESLKAVDAYDDKEDGF